MPYVIAFVIMIVAVGAILLFQRPVEAPAVQIEEVESQEQEEVSGFPEGFTPPTEDPPSTNPGGEVMMETDVEADVSITEEIIPEVSIGSTNETFVAATSYFTPARKEHELLVSLELEGETIVDANISYDGGTAATPMHTAFDAAYATEVIGQNISTIELSRVGGASLTSTAFNEAVVDIRAQL